jgi:hypothetical protein
MHRLSGNTAIVPPVVLAEEREYLASKHRIWTERAREQQELVKTLCNMPGANRIIAVAATAKKGGRRDDLNWLANKDLTGASMLFSDVHETIVGGQHSEIETQTSWERAQRQRRKSSIIEAVKSLDFHVSQANRYKRATLQSCALAVSRRNETPLLKVEVLESQYTDQCFADEEVDVCGYDVFKLTSASGWERRWKRINSVPGGAALERPVRTSIAVHQTKLEHPSTHEAMGPSRAEEQRIPPLMGVQRLQRAVQLIDDFKAGQQSSKHRTWLPEYFGMAWGPRYCKPSAPEPRCVRRARISPCNLQARQ